MKTFARTRKLLSGLPLFAAIRCIHGLHAMKENRDIGDFWLSYFAFGFKRRILIRGKHLHSDLQSVLELAAGDCYQIANISWKPDLVIDGGGNTGLFSLAATARWPDSKILCFEPMPENFDLIEMHVNVNGLTDRVEVYKRALAVDDGTAAFFLRDANQSSLSEALDYRSKVEVKLRSLHQIYAQQLDKNVLIKLDIEGAEFEILRDFFKRGPFRRILFVMEVHGNSEKYDALYQSALEGGFEGEFLERGSNTAHLVLFSKDLANNVKN